MENETQNEYFQKKENKEKAANTKETRKKVKKFLVWAVVLLVVGLAVWKVMGSVTNAPNIVEVKGDFFPAQSRDHISLGAAHTAYNSNPPTGGWHYGTPAQAGIYDKELADEQLIHNLEHGHVWIAYRPDLDPALAGKSGVDPAVVDKLAEITKSYGSKIIMAPRANNDTAIALSAWEYLLKLDNFDEIQIQGFIKAHRGKGPENIPAMSEPGFKDFRQK